MKSLLAALCALALLSARPPIPAATQEGIDPTHHPAIVKVSCLTGSGTAFYIGPRTLVTVAHVLTGGCFAGGKRFEVVSESGDFAILKVAERSRHWLQIDCKGFIGGKRYTAYGYARGLDTITSIDSESKGDIRFGFSRLQGVFHVIPGQSGGPFIDPASGKAVGTVNVFDPFRGDSGSMALKETSLCR